jgi:hypothetical protein
VTITLLYWLLASVFLSLLHLGIGVLIWFLRGRLVPFQSLLSGGSLLFFAASLTAKSFTDHYRRVSTIDHPVAALAVLAGMLLIVLPTTAIYSLIVVDATSKRSRNALSHAVIAQASWILSAVAIIYGFAVLVLILNLGGINQ